MEFTDIGSWLLFIVIFLIIAFIWRFKDRQTQRSGEEPEVLELPVDEEPEEEPAEEEEPPELPVDEEELKKLRRKGVSLPPHERGGRSRVTEKNGDEKPKGTRPYRWRPEIVCWQRERLWYVGVEVTEDLLDNDLNIFQNNTILTQDEFDDCRWLLGEVNIPVEIRCGEDEEYTVHLDKKYLLFKLTGSDQNRGCCVRSPSFGSYFAIVPETWERDIELSGLPPVSRQPVWIKGYQGHFFNLEKDDDRKIAFRNDNNELITIESEKARFEIIGNLLNDYCEYLGPLFGDGQIMINSLNSQGWSDVGTVVIGEEGTGRGRWRTHYNPDQNKLDQELPSDVMSRKGGWYFVRFYDESENLMESLDFRFVSGLRDIKMLQSSIIPSEEGHGCVHVEFSHDSNIDIQPKSEIEGFEILRDVNRTTITIPPRNNFDKTSWIIGPETGPQVEVNVLVERVWWWIGSEDEPPFEWKDKPITLSRDDFTPTSNKSLYLRFPKPRWIDAVTVGFERDRARSYNVIVEENTIGIPLRDFGDSYEVENEELDAYLSTWLNRGTEKYEIKLASLLSSNQPSAPEEKLTPVTDGVGYGRKRRAIAEATLIRGPRKIMVNDTPLWEYFKNSPEKAKMFMRRLLQIEEVSKALLDFQVIIIVEGSSPNTMQQAKAATHALARALMKKDPDLKRLLKRMNDFGGVRVRGLPTRSKE